ncbi:hypothetical protein LCGC14_2702500, partial [marine sediment metagenome]
RYGGRGIKMMIPKQIFIAWYIREAQGRTDLTIDRIDNDGHYELGNIQLISMGDNIRKAHRESEAMMISQSRNIQLAHAESSKGVRIGDHVFQSIREAGKFFSPSGNFHYVHDRIRRNDSLMPDGTPIEIMVST